MKFIEISQNTAIKIKFVVQIVHEINFVDFFAKSKKKLHEGVKASLQFWTLLLL